MRTVGLTAICTRARICWTQADIASYQLAMTRDTIGTFNHPARTFAPRVLDPSRQDWRIPEL